MNHSQLRGRRTNAALVSLVGILTAFTPLQAQRANPGSNGNGNGNSASVLYSGQATAVIIDGVTQPVPGQIVVADTGPLPVTGGHIQVSTSDFNYHNGLFIDHAAAMTSGSGRETLSTATLTGFRAIFEENDGTHTHRAVIEADFIYSEAKAVLHPNGNVSLSTNVIVDGLRVNGTPVVVTGQPNQRVELPPGMGGWLILNAQANSAGSGGGDIAVSAIQFRVCHCVDGFIGLVRAGIGGKGTPPADEDCGKVTGGGWIVAPSGAKGTFGMSGGIRRGEFWGHLTYIDHGTKMKVKSTAVTNFELDPTNPNGRIITYAVTINGAAGTATLRVVDNGEPGRNDVFDLTLSTGYHAAGELGGSRPGGGNIQLHKCPPGWR